MRFLFLFKLLFFGTILFGQSNSHWSGLPLLKSSFQKAGVEFPRPIGVGVAFMYMSQDYRMDNMRIDGNPLDFFRVNKAAGNDFIVMPRIDVWVLPFLNAYVFVGSISGQLDLDVRVQDPDIPPINFNVPLSFEYTGTYYGLGSNLTLASNNLFTMVDANYANAKLSEFNSKLKMTMVSARFGYIKSMGENKMMLWLGTMYQDMQQTLEQVQDGALVSIDVAAAVPLNLLFGSKYDFNDRFGIMLEIGFFERKQLLAHAEYRF